MEGHRQRQGVEPDERRRGARLRLRAAQQRRQRVVRRPAAGGQPLLRQPGVPRRPHRRAQVALPDGPPRSVGLRQPDGAGARRHHRRRTAHQGRDPGDQAGVRVRLRSRDRRAGVADRGTAGAEVDSARRVDRADAALPHPAGAVRSSGTDRRRPDRLHARAEGRGAGDRQAVDHRSDVHAADDRGHGAGREEGHAVPPRLGRRRQLGRRRGRSRDRRALRAVGDVPVARRADARVPAASPTRRHASASIASPARARAVCPSPSRPTGASRRSTSTAAITSG